MHIDWAWSDLLQNVITVIIGWLAGRFGPPRSKGR